jgi:protein-S-isoprenylcysteine O-methyltransferase Ste14
MNNWTGIFILSCWVVFFIYWVVNAANVKQNIEKHISLRYIFLLSLVVGAVFITMLYEKTFLQNTLWKASTRLGIVTDLLVSVGLSITLWARATLGKNWSAHVTLKKGHKLIKHGPYAVVRHPIYSGMIIMSVGTAINIGRVYAFVLLAAMLVGFIAKFRLEEELMLKHFTKEYKLYKKRVKALVPYIF